MKWGHTERAPVAGGNLLLANGGDSAATEAAVRADEFLDRGDIDDNRLWTQIKQAIEELQRERPGDGEAVH